MVTTVDARVRSASELTRNNRTKMKSMLIQCVYTSNCMLRLSGSHADRECALRRFSALKCQVCPVRHMVRQSRSSLGPCPVPICILPYPRKGLRERADAINEITEVRVLDGRVALVPATTLALCHDCGTRCKRVADAVLAVMIIRPTPTEMRPPFEHLGRRRMQRRRLPQPQALEASGGIPIVDEEWQW